MARIIELREMRIILAKISGKYLDRYVSQVICDLEDRSKATLSQSLSRMFGIGTCSIYNTDTAFFNSPDSDTNEGGDFDDSRYLNDRLFEDGDQFYESIKKLQASRDPSSESLIISEA